MGINLKDPAAVRAQQIELDNAVLAAVANEPLSCEEIARRTGLGFHSVKRIVARLVQTERIDWQYDSRTTVGRYLYEVKNRNTAA